MCVSVKVLHFKLRSVILFPLWSEIKVNLCNQIFYLFSLQSVKNPKFVYRHLQSLLGKKHDNLQVALYQKHFPEHQLLKEEDRGTVYFKDLE